MNALHGIVAKVRVPAQRLGLGECVLVKVDKDTNELAETAINILLALESRTREQESPSIRLEESKR
jgi:hypothetical protein